jgi:hypothetical protein
MTALSTPAPTTVGTATEPSVGLVTWDSEGQEGGPYHSRKLHVPSDSSGLTIGRGYDMKERKISHITEDLTVGLVLLADAKTIAKAAGLSGEDAKKFIIDNGLQNFEISKIGQRVLFERTYAKYQQQTKRLCTKADVTEKYGVCAWDKLDPAIVEILVDLTFRGDYQGTTRAFLQKHVVKNDLKSFADAVKLVSNWPNVPADRFKRRNDFLAKALAKAPKPPQVPLKKPNPVPVPRSPLPVRGPT